MNLKLHIFFLALVVSVALVQAQDTQPVRSREAFAVAMAKVTEGMPEKDVLTLLGKPDDIRTHFDPGGISRVDTREIWCYGAKGHLGFPTLGCVYIDTSGRAQESFGGKGHPPIAGLFTEDELQNLLELLDTAPGLEGYFTYNPLPIIRIVNTLQPLGKEKSLAAIREYIRVSDEWSGSDSARSGMFLVLRTLFDLPNNINPDDAGGFGAADPPPPKDPHRIPRFPIAITDDIPLMLVNGYSLEGMATPMEDVVDFYRKNGKIRPSLLAPSGDPLGALERLVKSDQWIYADISLQATNYSFYPPDQDSSEKAMLMEQLLRLIDSVYRMPVDALGDRLPCGEPPEPTWQRIKSEVSTLKIKWDSKQNIYVFADGTHLPDLEKKIYQRKIWKLDGLGFKDAELTLQRTGEKWVDIIVSSSQEPGDQLRAALLSIRPADNTKTRLETFSFAAGTGVSQGSTESRIIELPAGTAIQAKLEIEGYQTNSSPVFVP